MTAFFLTHWWGTIFHGSYSGTSYQFWSGVGGDIGELPVVVGLVVVIRRLNCHSHRCWRLGRFHHGHYVLCAKHHPLVPSNGKVTPEHVAAVSKTTSG